MRIPPYLQVLAAGGVQGNEELLHLVGLVLTGHLSQHKQVLDADVDLGGRVQERLLHYCRLRVREEVQVLV